MNKSILAKLCVLLMGTGVLYAQQSTEQDTLTKEPVQLDEVLVEGKRKTDPVFSTFKSEPARKIVQTLVPPLNWTFNCSYWEARNDGSIA